LCGDWEIDLPASFSARGAARESPAKNASHLPARNGKGKIMDRQGVLLATNQRVRGSYVPILPSLIDIIPRWQKHFRIPGCGEEGIRKRLKLNYVTHKGKEVLDPHVRLKIKVSNQEFDGLKDYLAEVPFC
jgi:hypothetical protein